MLKMFDRVGLLLLLLLLLLLYEMEIGRFTWRRVIVRRGCRQGIRENV
jgi:hypothetical protein